MSNGIFGLDEKHYKECEAVDKVAEESAKAAIATINQARLNLLKEFPELQTEEGQEFVNLSLPYDCVVKLLKSMMQGRSRDEMDVLKEMLISDLSEIVAEPAREFTNQNSAQLQKASAGVLLEVSQIFAENPHWTDEQKYVFIAALCSSCISSMLEQFAGSQAVTWPDYEKFLDVLQDCLVDSLTVVEKKS